MLARFHAKRANDWVDKAAENERRGIQDSLGGFYPMNCSACRRQRTIKNMDKQKTITLDELAHFAAALSKRIKDDNSIDINEFRTAQKFFLKYVTNTDFIKAFAEQNNYKIIASKSS